MDSRDKTSELVKAITQRIMNERLPIRGNELTKDVAALLQEYSDDLPENVEDLYQFVREHIYASLEIATELYEYGEDESE